jgi:hypothetical protein
MLVLEKIFKNFQCIFTLPLSPLLLNKPESPSSKDNLCQVWLKLVQYSGEEVENVKVYRWTDKLRRTGDQKSSLELSAQVS